MRTERFVTTGGVELAVDRYGEGASSLIVVSHGIFGYRTLPELVTLSRDLSTSFDVVTLDCRGHGDSTGRFTFGLREWRDLAELVQRYRGEYERIGGLGFSFGAFHTCIAAAQTGCFDAVTMVAGPKSFAILDHFPFGRDFVDNMRLARHRHRRWTKLGYPLRRRLMPIDCVGDIRVPIHFVHGKRDWLIHYKQSVQLHARARAPKTLSLLEDGMHAEYLIEQMPERVLPVLREWFEGELAL